MAQVELVDVTVVQLIITGCPKQHRSPSLICLREPMVMLTLKDQVLGRPKEKRVLDQYRKSHPSR